MKASFYYFLGGMMSVFLMGCYDPNRRIWCTVTKVHTGHDDKTLERLQVLHIFLFDMVNKFWSVTCDSLL